MANHKLIFGNCLEIMKNIPDKSIDMVLTDPPYGTTACKWDSVIPLEPMWKQLCRIIKKNSPIVLMSSQPFTSFLIISNIKSFKYLLVWKKSKCGSPFLAKYRPMMKHEDVVIFEKSGKRTTYNPQMIQGKPYHRISKLGNVNSMGFGAKEGYKYGSDNGLRYLDSILDFPQLWRRQDQIHPTQKPIELMEYLIKTYTNISDTVLDFTCGSGSTLVACRNLNRNSIGIDNGYCEKDKIINGIQINGLKWVEITQLRLDGKI